MWKAKCEEQQKHIDCMVEQVRLYNARRREKHKEVRLNEQKKTIKELTKRANRATAALQKVSTERSLAYYYKRKCEKLAGTECTSCNCQQEEENRELKERLLELQEINAQLRERVCQLEKERRHLVTYTGGRYTDDVRACVMELLANNVSIFNVGPVIRSVLKLTMTAFLSIQQSITC